LGFGAWDLEFGAWNLELGAWSLELGIWIFFLSALKSPIFDTFTSDKPIPL